LKTIDDTHTANGIDFSLGKVTTTQSPGKNLGEDTSDWAPYAVDILDYNDDSQWTVFLEYVPKEYLDKDKGVLGSSAVSAFVGTVRVDIPVATFDGTIRVAKRHDTHLLGLMEFKATPTELSEVALSEINDRWTFTATYRLNNQPITKTMNFTASMFYQGNYGLGSHAAVYLNDNGALSRMDVISSPTNPITSGIKYLVNDQDDISRNFPLPVRFRGE